MRVALFGGTGYVGSYITEALIAAGMTPILLVRPGSEKRIRNPDACETVIGDVTDRNAVTLALSDADVAIYNIGLLREHRAQGITFEKLHHEAAVSTMDTAVQQGVNRFLLMSANGVRANGTAYQHTKYLAEEHLKVSDLDWTIFRPSVIFGDPCGRMEFATQLLRDLVQSPMPAPLFFPGVNIRESGRFRLSPVHVQDVADAFVRAITEPAVLSRRLKLGGPDALTWEDIIRTIAKAAGRTKSTIPVPASAVNAVSAFLDHLDAYPITREQLRMLMEGNTCEPDDFGRLGIEPRAFDLKHLSYLSNDNNEDQEWLKKVA